MGRKSFLGSVLVIFFIFLFLLITGCIFKQTFTVTLKASPESGGEVRFNSANWAGETTKQLENREHELSLFARSNRGYGFSGWYKDTTLLGTNSSHTLTVDTDTTFIASFTAVQAL